MSKYQLTEHDKQVAAVAYEEGRAAVTEGVLKAMRETAEKAAGIGGAGLLIEAAFRGFAKAFEGVEGKRAKMTAATVDPAPEQVSP